MATQAYIIVSHDTTLDKEPAGTVEAEAILSADVDALWESEAGPSNISLARRIPPRFVPASSTYSTIQQQLSTSTSLAANHESGDIGSWYAGLSRVQQASEQARHPPIPASKPKKKQPPSKNDWFIRRALSNVSADTQPVPKSSLADMLEQSPPSLEDPLRPPIFLHLGPSNRGWGMLQRHGWEEGQPLGLGNLPNAPSPHDQPAVQTSSQSDISAESTPANDDNLAASSRTALVTPLRTTLKVDKRGIAPRSKTTSKPAVTHTFHEIRIAAEKARRERDGRGKRGFARTAKREAEERSRLLQELK
ncbi:hypothetical protein BDV93DRAFT_520439 [Ceratobasidium sp. AG-I]|nr:hypothetical protein BDV93DRAFT_520439 [Ceratobasidium sp. AG-I]